MKTSSVDPLATNPGIAKVSAFSQLTPENERAVLYDVYSQGTPEEAGISPDRLRKAGELIDGWVKEDITPAFVILVARHGVIVLHEAFGRLTPEPDSTPCKRDTIFPLCSLT